MIIKKLVVQTDLVYILTIHSVCIHYYVSYCNICAVSCGSPTSTAVIVGIVVAVVVLVLVLVPVIMAISFICKLLFTHHVTNILLLCYKVKFLPSIAYHHCARTYF